MSELTHIILQIPGPTPPTLPQMAVQTIRRQRMAKLIEEQEVMHPHQPILRYVHFEECGGMALAITSDDLHDFAGLGLGIVHDLETGEMHPIYTIKQRPVVPFWRRALSIFSLTQ